MKDIISKTSVVAGDRIVGRNDVSVLLHLRRVKVSLLPSVSSSASLVGPASFNLRDNIQLLVGKVTPTLDLGGNTLNKASIPSAWINPISEDSKALAQWVSSGSSKGLVRVSLLKTLNRSTTTSSHGTLALVILRQALNKASVIIREGLGGKSSKAVGVGNSGHVFLLTYII